MKTGRLICLYIIISQCRNLKLQLAAEAQRWCFKAQMCGDDLPPCGVGRPGAGSHSRQDRAEPRLLFHVAQVGGRTVHPAACCSASPPMRGRLALSPGPMRAAGSGLGLRVGLFNLRGGQQSAPEYHGWMRVGDGNVTQFITDVGRNPRSRGPRVKDHHSRRSCMEVTADFEAIIASQLRGCG